MVHDTENAGWNELRAEALEDAKKRCSCGAGYTNIPSWISICRTRWDRRGRTVRTRNSFAALRANRRHRRSLRIGSGPDGRASCGYGCVAVREESGCSFASKIPGVMHACGHDIHVAGALGAARLLARRREAFRERRVSVPARRRDLRRRAPMIRDGALDSPESRRYLRSTVRRTLSPERSALPRRFRAASDMLDFRSPDGCHGAEPQREPTRSSLRRTSSARYSTPSAE
jgi:hypothetical protein